MRCGRNSKNVRMSGKSDGPRWMGIEFNSRPRWSKAHVGEHDMVTRVGPIGEASVWCRKWVW